MDYLAGLMRRDHLTPEPWTPEGGGWDAVVWLDLIWSYLVDMHAGMSAYQEAFDKIAEALDEPFPINPETWGTDMGKLTSAFGGPAPMRAEVTDPPSPEGTRARMDADQVS